MELKANVDSDNHAGKEAAPGTCFEYAYDEFEETVKVERSSKVNADAIESTGVETHSHANTNGIFTIVCAEFILIVKLGDDTETVPDSSKSYTPDKDIEKITINRPQPNPHPMVECHVLLPPCP